MTKAAPEQVVVVSKQARLSGLLETMLDAGHYDVVLVESTEHAYSHIKRVSPQLVIVCVDMDDMDVDGFQVLSMLKLDHDTRDIPIVTCTLSADDDEPSDEAVDPRSAGFSEVLALGMN